MRSRERLAKIRLPLIEIKITLLPLTFGYQRSQRFVRKGLRRDATVGTKWQEQCQKKTYRGM